MIRRLLQRLDQVVPILRIYGPQGAFAYALTERKEEGKKKSGKGKTDERTVNGGAPWPLEAQHKHS